MANPKISVLMPVYNGSEYLQESIDSILHQTYTDFEFIIIDDASTDGTWEILKLNSQRDDRIRLLQNSENLGLIKTLNKGIDAALGKYIARQDADDISMLNRFEREIDILESQPDCVMVSSDIQVVQNSSKKVIETLKRSCKPEIVAWYLLFYNHVGGHSQVMYRRDSVLALGGYSEAQPHIEDYELWCRFSEAEQKIVILPEVLLTYRRHEHSVSAKKGKEQDINRCNQVSKNIAYLTGKVLTPEEAKALTGFWRGNRTSIFEVWHHRFPQTAKAEFIRNTLVEIKKGFVKKYGALYPESNLEQEVDNLIDQQFLSWLRSPLTRNHNLASKAQLTPYLLRRRYSILTVTTNWALWLLRSPIDLLISIYRRLFSVSLLS